MCASPLLQSHQKIVILNQNIWPSLVYPFQCTPLKKIRSGFLQDVDKIIRGAAKEIIGLPHDCPNDFLYAPMKFRGLSLMKAKCEVYIQHVNICNALLKVDDVLPHFVRHLDVEKSFSLSKLAITSPEATHWSGRHIRLELRTTAFKLWSSHSLRGKGVILYSETPKSNFWVGNKKKPFFL